MPEITNIQLNSVLKDAVDTMIHGTGLTSKENGDSIEIIDLNNQHWGAVTLAGTDEQGNQRYKYDSTVCGDEVISDFDGITNYIHDDMAECWDYQEVPQGAFKNSMESVNPRLRRALTEAFVLCHKRSLNESEYNTGVSEYSQYVDAQLNMIVQYMTKYGGSTDAASSKDFDQENVRSHYYVTGTIGNRIVHVSIENYGSHQKGDYSLKSLENGTNFHVSTTTLDGSRDYKDIFAAVSSFKEMGYIFQAVKMDASSFEPDPSESWDQWWRRISRGGMQSNVESASKNYQHIINESESSSSKKKWINRIYVAAEPYTKGLKRDNNWENVWQLFDVIKKAVPEVSFDVGTTDGGYVTNSDGMKSKVYKITGQTPEGFPINGQLVCSFCGPSSDPESCYDMSLILN